MSGFDFNKSFQSLQGSVSGIGASFTPFAKRTTRLLQEKLGNVEDKTELPEEYLQLEARVDALKIVHQRLLSVTSIYGNESYDYPPNLKESFNDLSKTISEKVNEISHAQSAQEAQQALVSSPHKTKREPKTLNHALARAAEGGADALATSSTGEQPLGTALHKYAVAEEKIGEARISQDSLISTRFNSAVSTTLNTSLNFASKARRNVANARLSLDAAKAAAKSARPEKQAQARIEVEQAEDEFVAAIEEAISVMKNVLDTPEPLRNLLELITAQLAYHKAASELLGQLVPEIETLQTEQETAYRESRESP